MATPTQDLATLKLGRDVSEWAYEKRDGGNGPSFQAIADELRDLTGIKVTDETIRNWCLRIEHHCCPTCPQPTWHNGDECPNAEAKAS